MKDDDGVGERRKFGLAGLPKGNGVTQSPKIFPLNSQLVIHLPLRDISARPGQHKSRDPVESAHQTWSSYLLASKVRTAMLLSRSSVSTYIERRREVWFGNFMLLEWK